MGGFLLGALHGALIGTFGTAWALGSLPDPVESFLNAKVSEAAAYVCEASNTLIAKVSSREREDRRLDGKVPVGQKVSSPLTFAGLQRPPPREQRTRMPVRIPVRKPVSMVPPAALRGGIISSSLYEAALEAGISDPLVMSLINIYSYDFDFQREIRRGDIFEVLLTPIQSDTDVPIEKLTIVYASLTVQGRQKSYYRFRTPDDGVAGYYSWSGHSAKKFLMRTPINGARISSRFGPRLHPILGYTRDHLGTDFAAPAGTPVFASGDGIVERSSPNGSYGNYIQIDHGSGFKTAYAHLSRYGQYISPGRTVSQGQVIGYVGATGRVTGPHLHYEVLHNKVRVNPQRISVPTRRELEGQILSDFKVEAYHIKFALGAQPDWRKTTLVADASKPDSEG